MSDEVNKEKWERLKKKGREKAEAFALRGILEALKKLLPDEAADLINEFNDPKVYEPYLRDAFLMMFKSLDIPPQAIRFVIAFNGNAERMIYAVDVINIHDNKFHTVEFPMAMFLSNLLIEDKRTKTVQVVRESILAMRYYKPNIDGSRGGVLQLGNGEILKLNM